MNAFKLPVILCAALALLPAKTLWAEAKAGEAAPNFTLTDSNGKSHQLSELKGKTVVLEWVNYECPFVKKHYDSGNMQGLQKEYTGKGVVWLAVASSAEGKQGYYAPKETNEMAAKQKSAATAILLDADGTVGRLYGAKTTPQMFIINPEGKVVYAGAIDDKASAKPEDIATSKNYVKSALDETLAGKPVSTASTVSYGCSVKYK